VSRPRRTANDVRRTHSLNARILSRKRSFDCPFWTKPRNFAPRANDSAIVRTLGGNPTSPGKTAPPPGPAGHGGVSLYRGVPPSGLGAGARRAGRAESWDTSILCTPQLEACRALLALLRADPGFIHIAVQPGDPLGRHVEPETSRLGIRSRAAQRVRRLTSTDHRLTLPRAEWQ